MKNIYYIKERNNHGNTAGTKLKDDLMLYFEKSGFFPVNKTPIYSKKSSNPFYFLQSLILGFYLKTQLSKLKNSILIIVYPAIKSRIWFSNRVLLKLKKRGNKLIFYVFDLVYFQNKCFDVNKSFKLGDEARILNIADVCLFASDREAKLLKENGLQSKTIALDFLDLFCEPILNKASNRNPNSISFCGYLTRATFLEKLSFNESSFVVDCFGDGFCYHDNHTLRYIGSFSSEALTNKMANSKYGLVWDGQDIDTFGNFYEGYEKYIIPHKACSYIAAGLPLICWEDSALYDFVRKNGIGIGVSSLLNLPKTIESISDSDYAQMIKNIKKIQDKISSFYYHDHAFFEAISFINKSE